MRKRAERGKERERERDRERRYTVDTGKHVEKKAGRQTCD